MLKNLRGIGTMLALAPVIAGCGQSAKTATKVVWRDVAYTAPSDVATYHVSEEKAAADGLRQGGADSLIDGGRLYSFRLGTRLFATMEVAELKAGSNATDTTFQQNVVAQIGTSVMRAVTIDKQVVYEGTGNRELVYVWFKGRLLHVVLTHDVKDPTPLVKELIKLK